MTDTVQTLYCPNCGQDGAFDGCGSERKQKVVIGSDGQGTTVIEHRYRHRCPDCGNEFLTVDQNPMEADR